MDAFLADAQLTEFSEPLKALGCVEVGDLADITDDEYAEMGMSKVHVRRLRRKCAAAQTQGALGLGKEGEPVVVVEAVAIAPPPTQVAVGLSRPASPPRSADTSTTELLMMLERMEQQRPRCFVCNGSGQISGSRVPTETRLKPLAADSESLIAKPPEGYKYTVVTTEKPVQLQKEGRCYACIGAGDLAYGTVKCKNCDGKGKTGAYIDVHDHQAACIASYCFA
eukprot:COSAG01_NODE_5523_length_4206_cov_4.069150_4_plen_223_part_01